MKITEVVEECRARAESSRKLVAGEPKDRYVLGAGKAYDAYSDMLDKAVCEIQEELNRVRADAKNGELSGPIRANAEAMAMVLEWVLGKDQK